MQLDTNINRNKDGLTRAVLVGIVTRDDSADEVERELDELARLLDTAGGVELARVVQNKETPDPRTVIGSGKIAELSELCRTQEAELVVFDTELSPSQIKNIEDDLGTDVRVIDRSMLILDIFALHATSGEGKLQVELAQLKYTAPRLIGKGKELSRLGGGIGTRGPGESKLESDRRHIKRRIVALEEEIDELERTRMTMRAGRDRSRLPQIAIVGYTNAGKSTLLNTLTDAGILAEDKLFATLDPTTRKMKLPCGETVLLTDTVGFIRKLPHHLVKAFRSTLDEAVYADILMIVIDAHDDEAAAQLEVTESLLASLGAAGKPTVYVYNKCDLGVSTALPSYLAENKDPDRVVCAVSAKTGEGLDALLSSVESIIHSGKRRVTFVIPNAEQSALSTLYKTSTVESVDYGTEAVTVVATVDARVRGMLRKYDTSAEDTVEEY